MANVIYKNWFPFPVPESTDPTDVGVGTPFLIGYPLGKVIEIYWRAKKFKVQINATGHLPVNSKGPGTGYPHGIVDESLSDPGSMAWDAKHIEPDGITNIGFDLSASVRGSAYEEPGTMPPYPPFNPDIPDIALDQNYWGEYHANMAADFTFNMFFSAGKAGADQVVAGVKNPRMIKYNDLYYPTIAFSINSSIVDFFDHVIGFGNEGQGIYYPNGNASNPNAHWEGASYNYPYPPPFFGEGWSANFSSVNIVANGSFNLTGTIFGVDIGGLGFTLATNPSVTGYAGQSIDYSGDVNIDISEWFTYDKGDGHGPWFDKDSGAWLN